MKILTLDEWPWSKIDEQHRRVFLRVDFNVPIKNGVVTEDFRIRQAIPTIRNLLEHKCIVVLASHLGRPKGDTPEDRKKYSLLPVAERLAELLDHDVLFSEEIIGDGPAKLILDGRGGKTVILLENLRFDPREEKNDRDFAEALMKNCDLYVNDAFGASHRAHASVDAASHYAQYKAAGLLLIKEWQALNEVIEHPLHPQMAILGGAKISDKIQVIKNLMLRCESLFIGGRMGQTFLASQGFNLGASSIEEEALPLARRILAEAQERGVKVYLPEDGRAALSIDSKTCEIIPINSKNPVPHSLGVFDIGPATLAKWSQLLLKAKSVVWNGPLGVFENPIFAEGTLGLVDFLAAHKDSLRCTAGGGETVAAIMKRNAFASLHHVSTGGGAMLEFFEGKALPGFEALKLRDREVAALGQQ